MIMYLLDKQQNIIKALDNTIVEASMIEEINAANKLTFSVMTNSRIDISIHYVCIPAPKGEEFLLFKLISETVKNDRVEYTAVESAYDELKSYAYIKDARPQDKTAGEMLTQILQGTRWSLGYIADTARASTNFYYITVLEAIQKVVDLFNVELTFTVNIDKKTNVISSRRINLYTQQGRRLGKRFEYGSNLLEVTREQSSEDLITALVGRGKGEEVSQGEDGSPDGYGRRITFADIEWKRANGNPADKPKGQEYVEDKDATALYGFSDGKPRIGLTTFEDITDPQELLKATWASLQVAKRPKVSFKASVLNVGDLGLGDTVAIIRHDLGIEYFTRVYKVDHDLLDKNNNTIELGDDFSQKSLTNYVSDVAKITENAKNTAEYAVSSANGKNKNYYSKSKPQYANEGDNLFLDLGNGETEYYVWHDGNWELVLSTADTTRVQKQVEEVQRDIADARVEADRLSQEQSKTAKELSDKITDISDKAIKNASDIKSVTDDIANVHADYVSQQANLNQQKQDIDQARQDVLSNSSRLDKLEVGVNGVSINVNNLNTKVDNIKIGGTNLVSSMKENWEQKYVIISDKDYTSFYENTHSGRISHKGFIKVYPNSSYTVSLHELGSTDYYFKVTMSTVDSYGVHENLLNKDEWIFDETYTFITPNNCNFIKISVGANVNILPDDVHTKFDIKIEKGTVSTDWSPAPEDEIERVAQLKVDLDGIRGTVANAQGDIAQIKLTENGMQQNIRDAQGNISTLQNDAKQFKQRFADVDGNIATIKRNATELSEQLASKVGNTEYQNFKTQTAKELSQKLVRTDLNGYATTAEVKLTADGFKEQYTQLNGKIDGIVVGGKNLLDNSDSQLIMGYGIDNTTWTNGKATLVYNHDYSKTNKLPEILPQTGSRNRWYRVNKDEELTQSIIVETDATYNPNGIYQFSWFTYEFSHRLITANIDVLGTNKYRLWCSFKWDKDQSCNVRIMDIQNLTKVLQIDNSGTYISFYHPQIERGNKASDWGMSDNDIKAKVDDVSSDLTNYKAVVERDYAKNSSVYTKNEVVNLTNNSKDSAVNTIKNDANWKGLVNINTNSAFLQTADGFEKEVVKRATPMVEGGGVNLARGTKRDLQNASVTGTWFFIGGDGRPYFNNLSSYQGKHITVRVWIERPTADAWVQIWTNKVTISGNHIKAGQSGYSTASGVIPTGFTDWNIPVGGGAQTMSFGWKELKIELGEVATPWTPAPEDLATKLQLNQVIDTADSHTRTITDYLTGSNSRFTQLSNNVNLKVNKGDVIGQINLEAGRTLLQNQKIYLDADTVGFSGKAFIPSAAIKDLDAGKITTGTLDAANVNIINLNANNITSGSIKGTNLDINLNSGNVSFQKGRIHDSNNYVDINIDEGYISTANNLGRLLFKENSLQIAAYNMFDHTNDYYLKIDNGSNGGSWAGANITGRDYISISNKANSGETIGQYFLGKTDYAGLAAGKSTFGWMPTFLAGADRGVMVMGGSYMPGSWGGGFQPYIAVGSKNIGKNFIPEKDEWYGNRIIIRGDYVHLPETYNKTTSAAPNVYVADDGALVRSTSAAKYKTDIVRSHDLDYGNKILDVPIATWIDKAEAERYAKKESEQEPVRHFGMIADDLASAGLEMLVTRNNDGELEGIQYDRIAPALIPVISNLKARLELLERKLLNE